MIATAQGLCFHRYKLIQTANIGRKFDGQSYLQEMKSRHGADVSTPIGSSSFRGAGAGED
ncbi:hypothetical protein ACI7BZ_15530 [Xanthobacter sp. AM11]|uniref:hypothetical protein n=1 Tax=Xanthobacter sp. AM11 TaxID=3380643 RepID=UPI0039BFA9CF